MSTGGKGSSPRPLSVPREQFGAQHEVIFGVRTRARWEPPAVCTRCSGAHELDECEWPLVPEGAP